MVQEVDEGDAVVLAVHFLHGTREVSDVRGRVITVRLLHLTPIDVDAHDVEARAQPGDGVVR